MVEQGEDAESDKPDRRLLIAATEQPPGSLCRACFDGHYPVPVPESERGKGVLEPVTS